MATYQVELNPVPNRHGDHAVRIRVISTRKKKCFSLKFSVKNDEFDENTQRVKTCNLQHMLYNKKISVKLHELESTVLEKEITSVDYLKYLLTNGGVVVPTLYDAVMTAAAESEEEGQTRTADAFKSVAKVLMLACAGGLPVNHLDVTVLQKFERYLKKTRRPNTVNKYLSLTRTVVKRCVRLGHIKSDKNPFINYEMPSREKTYREKLDLIDIVKLEQAHLPIWSHNIARDIFLFSYYTGGMRIGDVLTLEQKQIVHGGIVYDMGKTNVHRECEQLPTKARAILSKYDPNNPFVFGLLDETYFKLDKRHQNKRIEAKTAFVNKFLKVIATNLGITKNLHCHIARHTWGSIGKKLGVDVSTLQHIYGHSDLKTTQIYLNQQNVGVDAAILEAVANYSSQPNALKVA